MAGRQTPKPVGDWEPDNPDEDGWIPDTPDLYSQEAKGTFMRRLGEAVNPLPMIRTAARPPEGLPNMGPGGNLAAHIGLSSILAAEEAERARKAGETGRAVTAGISAVPFVGPTVGGVAEDLRQKNYPAALGTLTGLAVPFAALKGLSRLAPALQESAERSYSRALGPTTGVNKALTDRVVRGADVSGQRVPGLLERGVVAGTRKGLQEKAADMVESVGNVLDDAHANLPPDLSLPLQQVTDAIDAAAAARFKVATPRGPVNLSRHADASLSIIDDLKQRLTAASETNPQTGEQTVPYQTLRRFRQDWDKIVYPQKYKLAAEPGSSVAAYEVASDNLRAELNRATPDVAAIGREFNFWGNVKRVMDATVMRTKSQATPMGRQIIRGGAMAGGLATGGPLGAAESAAVVNALDKLVTSTGWNTVSAVAKSRLADVLAAGDGKNAVKLMGSMMATGAAKGEARKEGLRLMVPFGVPELGTQ